MRNSYSPQAELCKVVILMKILVFMEILAVFSLSETIEGINKRNTKEIIDEY